jgi:hypothetical protein
LTDQAVGGIDHFSIDLALSINEYKNALVKGQILKVYFQQLNQFLILPLLLGFVPQRQPTI